VKSACLVAAFCALLPSLNYGQNSSSVPAYNSDVAPLLAGNCMQCHRPGQVARSLMRYEEARQSAAAIKEQVLARSMPPWHADSRYGVFANERVLNDDQIRTIVSWVDAGAPRGDPRQTPLLPEFADGWPLGQPDIVVPMQEEFTVPAGGSDLFTSFEIPMNLPQDIWVAAAEIQGNRRVVHDAAVFVDDGQGNPGSMERLVSGSPGEMYEVFPASSAKLVKAGSRLILAVHYRPSMETQKDRASVGLVLAKGPVLWQIFSRALDGKREFVFPTDSELIEMTPRMPAGSDVTYTAAYPNNRGEILLSVPRYDANWPASYELAQPVPMPRGTKISVAATVENSEMIEGWFDYRVRR
jgi:hypothetical protein